MTKILYFYAGWCGPCQQTSPIINKLNDEGFPVTKIDVDENQQTASEYDVRSIPTVIIEKDDEIQERYVGTKFTAEKIKEHFE